MGALSCLCLDQCVRKLSTALRGIVEEELAGELPDSVIRAEKYVCIILFFIMS